MVKVEIQTHPEDQQRAWEALEALAEGDPKRVTSYMFQIECVADGVDGVFPAVRRALRPLETYVATFLFSGGGGFPSKLVVHGADQAHEFVDRYGRFFIPLDESGRFENVEAASRAARLLGEAQTYFNQVRQPSLPAVGTKFRATKIGFQTAGSRAPIGTVYEVEERDDPDEYPVKLRGEWWNDEMAKRSLSKGLDVYSLWVTRAQLNEFFTETHGDR